MSHTGVSLSIFFLMPDEEPLVCLILLLDVIRFHVLGCDVGIWAASERRCLLGTCGRTNFRSCTIPMQFGLNSMTKNKNKTKLKSDIKIRDLEATPANQALSFLFL